MRSRKVVVLAGLIIALEAVTAQPQERLSPDARRPIDAGDSLWTEELTFMEIRDAIHGGTTTVIIRTGGVEQNGPYVAGG
jgi:creatinine amidohydrolase